METRKTNLELLRIVAMILIIAHHFAVHSNFINNISEGLIGNALYIRLLSTGGRIGVNIFVIITGYFLVTRIERKICKLKKIWCQVFLYSLLIYFLFVVIGLEKYDYSAFIKNMFPITFDKWWFVSTYFVLYLLAPYLNIILRKVTKKEYINLLVCMTVLWCIIPTLTFSKMQSNNLIWFIYLYCIGGYISLYEKDLKKKNYFKSAVKFSVFYYFIIILFFILGLKFKGVEYYVGHFSRLQHLFILLMSVFWFMAFKSYEIKYSEKINVIASTTLGIYLIHDNELVRVLIWETIFESNKYLNTLYFIPYSLGAISNVFIICSVIDLIRKYFIEKYYLKLFDKGVERVKCLANSVRTKYLKN